MIHSSPDFGYEVASKWVRGLVQSQSKQNRHENDKQCCCRCHLAGVSNYLKQLLLQATLCCSHRKKQKAKGRKHKAESTRQQQSSKSNMQYAKIVKARRCLNFQIRKNAKMAQQLLVSVCWICSFLRLFSAFFFCFFFFIWIIEGEAERTENGFAIGISNSV